MESPKMTEVTNDLLQKTKVSRTGVSLFAALLLGNEDNGFSGEQVDVILDALDVASIHEADFIYAFSTHMLDLLNGLDESTKSMLTIDEFAVLTLRHIGIV